MGSLFEEKIHQMFVDELNKKNEGKPKEEEIRACDNRISKFE